MPKMNAIQKATLDLGTEILVHAGPGLAQIGPVREAVVHKVETDMLKKLGKTRATSSFPPGVDDDRTLMGLAILHTAERALTGCRLSDAARRGIFKNLVQTLLFDQGDESAIVQFDARNGCKPPMFLLISPGKACNLRCTGCYADSDAKEKTLDWDTFDRLITEAKTLWGARFFAISGGEPMAYRSQGKGILDIAEKHPDCLFIMYTNGTLIDDEVANRMARLGNLTPAISLEGWRERTDSRRGAGVFDQALAAMDRLRKVGMFYGVSLTATRHNAEEILSDAFIDFCFREHGVMYGFIFQYMPIGRSFTLDLMPTPQQRLWMWRRSWEIIRERQIFLADFWNHGTLSQGCISAGGFNGSGYLYVNWNGAVSPCAFLPYSPVNIHDLYSQGKTINDMWADPFFAGLRRWQKSYRQGNGNWLMPCPMRDHHTDLRKLLAEHEPEPIDASARAALLDADYARGLAKYGEEYQEKSGSIWTDYYLRQGIPSNGAVWPLPEINLSNEDGL